MSTGTYLLDKDHMPTYPDFEDNTVVMDEDDEGQVLRKLKPKIPDHNDAHPVAENMKIRKDSGLRLWRESDP